MGRRLTAAPPPVDDPAYRALKQAVIERTGHAYYADKDDILWDRLSARMAARGVATVDRYAGLLDTAPDEWAALESAVTINETFFFRFAEQFSALRRQILPDLIAAASDTRALRIWSVGCSTGAEPYSVAVLLDDLLGESLADWRITITATDIDRAALDIARSAVFSGWALRTVDPDERVRLFDREGDRFRLKPRYRGMVRFERHNMMALLDPAAALQFTGYDLILCRNVLIYFSPADATRMVGALVERLTPGGLCLLGHAEPNPDFASVASGREIGGVLAYRPLSSAHADPPPAPVAAAARFEAPPPRRPSVERPRARTMPVPPPLAAEPRDPAHHLTIAMQAIESGQPGAAEQAFRRALYLDSGFAMAHYLLGRHLAARGRSDDARRALNAARRLAERMAPDAPVPAAEDMTGSDLAMAARAGLATL